MSLALNNHTELFLEEFDNSIFSKSFKFSSSLRKFFQKILGAVGVILYISIFFLPMGILLYYLDFKLRKYNEVVERHNLLIKELSGKITKDDYEKIEKIIVDDFNSINELSILLDEFKDLHIVNYFYFKIQIILKNLELSHELLQKVPSHIEYLNSYNRKKEIKDYWTDFKVKRPDFYASLISTDN